MSHRESRSIAQNSRTLAEGRGWRAREVVCTAGPQDKPFEERHDSFSIAGVIAGTFTYRSTHGATFLAPGSLLLGNAGAPFECGHEHASGDRCIAFHYDPDTFEEIAAEIPSLRALNFPCHRVPPASGSVPLIARAWAALECGDVGDMEELVFFGAAEAIVSAHALGRKRARSDPPRDLARASEAVHFIEKNYRSDISLGSLASRAGLGRFHFLRLFRERVGTTPHQYLIHTRLIAAARALRVRRASVLDIAVENGFGDLSEFTRRFRRVFGTTPAKFARTG